MTLLDDLRKRIADDSEATKIVDAIEGAFEEIGMLAHDDPASATLAMILDVAESVVGKIDEHAGIDKLEAQMRKEK